MKTKLSAVMISSNFRRKALYDVEYRVNKICILFTSDINIFWSNNLEFS